jgi:hypothetical protein
LRPSSHTAGWQQQQEAKQERPGTTDQHRQDSARSLSGKEIDPQTTMTIVSPMTLQTDQFPTQGGGGGETSPMSPPGWSPNGTRRFFQLMHAKNNKNHPKTVPMSTNKEPQQQVNHINTGHQPKEPPEQQQQKQHPNFGLDYLTKNLTSRVSKFVHPTRGQCQKDNIRGSILELP